MTTPSEGGRAAPGVGAGRLRGLGVGLTVGFGALFAVGLGLSGLLRPEVIVGAVDFGGAFDPSLYLAFGAAFVGFLPFERLARRGPLLATRCDLPAARPIDARLLVGAAIFGVGWGLAGTCPGPAVVWLVSGTGEAVLFMAAMLAGMALFSAVRANITSQAVARAHPFWQRHR